MTNGIWKQIEEKGAYQKHKYDFQTPPEVAAYMVSLLPGDCKTVLEPTPGRGNIVNEIKKAGYDVTGPEDFFSFLNEGAGFFDAVILNPPFSSKFANMQNADPEFLTKKGMLLGYEILKTCLQLSNNVIALMPWFTISDSDIRLKYLNNYGIKSVTTLPRKTFDYARIQTVIIHFEKGFKGVSEFRVFSDKYIKTGSLF